MAKRKQDDSDIDVSSTDSESDVELENGEHEPETVDVDFDFFDLNPDVDFHATKNLLRQLFGDDAVRFDLSLLADLVLKDNSVGTCIKTDGKDSDPFALLSVVNLSRNLENATVKKVVEYALDKTGSQPQFNITLRKLLGDKKSGHKVGLIVSERLINMPVEVVPPMYKMLHEEMARAQDAQDKYEFDYFLVVSKVYAIVAGQEMEAEKSKKKKPSADTAPETDYFHYEDMVLEANSEFHGYYSYSHVSQETDSRRVFTEYGLDPKLSLMLLTKEQLAQSVPQMEEKFPPY